MKNVLLVLNVLLLLAVSFLFYKVYAKPSEKFSTVSRSTTSVEPSNSSRIAYVELDSLYENINYIKNMRVELEAEQKAIETEWQRGMRSLEAKRDNFVTKKGNNISQQEAEIFQAELMQEQQSIENKKQSAAGKFSDKSYRFMDDVQIKMRNFLKEYNADKGYTYILTSGTGLDYMIYKDSTNNITADVIAGMNQMFTAKK